MDKLQAYLDILYEIVILGYSMTLHATWTV